MEKKVITKEEFQEACNIIMRRIEEIQDQLNRLKECVNGAHYGNFNMEFLESEIYTEEASDRNKAKSYIPRIMEHLLKLKYCTNNRNYKKWIDSEIDVWRDVVREALGYDNVTGRNTNLIKEVTDLFEDLYNQGVKYYHDDAEDYDDLIPNMKCIPQKCVWNLDELLIKSIFLLLDKLPDPPELITQMQLYPFCHYYQDYDKIRGMQCITCKFYSECVSEYYERMKTKENKHG